MPLPQQEREMAVSELGELRRAEADNGGGGDDGTGVCMAAWGSDTCVWCL